MASLGSMDDDRFDVGAAADRRGSCVEPLLLILSPPPPFLSVAGEPATNWHKWLRAFECYIEALGENQLTDSSKSAFLQDCLGPEGQRIFSMLIPADSTYAAAVSALTLYFSSSCTSQSHHRRFLQRVQSPGETVDQFVSTLKDLLRPCNYRGLQDKVVLDQLIHKTSCPQLKERLLLERETLTLEKALAIGKEVESASNDCVPEVCVDIGDDLEPPVEKKAKRGRPRRGEKRAQRLTKPSSEALRRPQRHKDESNRTDPQHGDKDQLKESDSRADGGKNQAVRSLQIKVDTCRNTGAGANAADEVDDDDDEDEDSLTAPAQLKGPCCPVCVTRRFRDANKLARHMRTHTKEKPFGCPLCPVTFSQSYHMTRHMRNQHGAGPHICSSCGQSLGSYAELQTHKRAHKPHVHSCFACSQKFADNEAFVPHLCSHGNDEKARRRSEKREGKCPGSDCNNNPAERSAGSAASLVQVTIKTETKDVEEAEPQGEGAREQSCSPTAKSKDHSCPICVGRRFRGPNKLARHMRTHTKEKPFSCPVCALAFSQSYHMTRHLRNQHSLGEYVCSSCGKSLNTWLELRAHRKSHAVEGLTCLACDKQFKEKAALASHLRVHQKIQSSSPESLTCGECGKIFGRMYHLKRHMVTHQKEADAGGYTCPDCQKRFAFPEELNKHLQIHLKENNGTCPKCNKTFSSAEELEAHVRVHLRSFTCDTCGKKFKVEYALKKHQQGHQTQQYYCSLCRKRFTKLSHYKRHLTVHGRRETKCPHCDGVFLKLTAFKYHLRTHTEERPHQCNCCIETFQEKEDLEQHCLKHRKFKKERPYSCTRCDLAFSTLIELTEHMGSHEGEQPLNCPICGKTFLNKNKLEKHLTIHTGERPHLCSVCGNGFPSAASLKLHVSIHTGEKPFQCSQCSKSFRSSSGLRLHSRQHMEVRPSYKCPECGRTYGRMTELKMHQRYHTGDKPFECACCRKRFISKDKLNVHMRIHTGERPYSCHYCGQTFTQTGDRNRHISKFHLDAAENS